MYQQKLRLERQAYTKHHHFFQHMDKVCFRNNGPFSASVSTALSVWQYATPPYLTVWYHTPFLTWHPLIASLPTLSSPLSDGFCHAASTTSPTFVSLRFHLAGRQCPFLGTKYWREPHKRTNLSFSPHSRAPTEHRGPAPIRNGYFF